MLKATRASTSRMERQSGCELYNQDEHQWIAAQVSALASGHLNRLDRPNLIEYLTNTKTRDQREPRSRLIVLLHHLLKVQSQPERLTRSWATTIIEQQSEIRSIIQGIPSLGRQADKLAASAYPDAVPRAARETGIPAARFATMPPWTVEAALAFDPPEPVAKGKRHQ